MATPSIRGHQASFKLFQDGAQVIIDTLTNVSVNMDSNFSRAFYVGNATGEGDQTIEGWSGSFDFEVKDAKAEEFIDGLINDNLNGIGISDYVFMTTERYPNGTSSSYVYADCQFSISRTQSGLNNKITKTINFQASIREAL